jgi:hypothetical protein
MACLNLIIGGRPGEMDKVMVARLRRLIAHYNIGERVGSRIVWMDDSE